MEFSKVIKLYTVVVRKLYMPDIHTSGDGIKVSKDRSWERQIDIKSGVPRNKREL